MIARRRTGPLFAALLFVFVASATGQTSEETDLFQAAQLSFSAQKWTTAAAQFSTFVRAYPQSQQAPTADFLRGVCFYQASDPAAALDAFQKFVRVYPDHPYRARMGYWKGLAAFALGRYDVAEQELVSQQQFPNEKPFYPRSLFTLALVYARQNQLDAAERTWIRFAAESDEGEWKAKAWIEVGRLRRSAKNLKTAAVAFESASAAAKKTASDAQARFERLAILTEMNDWTAASALAQETAKLFPARIVEALSYQVEIERATKNVAGQRSALEAIASNSKDPATVQKAWTDLALLSEEIGSSDLKAWTSAIEGPSDELSWAAVRRANELTLQTSQAESALSLLQRWIQARPKSPHRAEALVLASKTAERAGQQKLAATLAQQAYDADSQSPVAAQSLLQRGLVALRSSDLEKSLLDFVRVARDFSSTPSALEARYQIGMVYLKRSEPLRAESYFYALVEELKTGELYERALLARGMCFSNAGQLDLARSSLQRFLREHPRSVWSSDAWFALGRTELQRRDFASAAEAFDRSSALSASKLDEAKALWASAQALVGGREWAKAAQAYRAYAVRFPQDEQFEAAVYRTGWSLSQLGDWKAALDAWSEPHPTLKTSSLLAKARASAFLRLSQPERAWSTLESIVSTDEDAAEAWFSWAQEATGSGQSDWANRAWEALIERFPDSKYVELALPRAAGALLKSGNRDQAFERYARYFIRFGAKSTSAAVARAVSASTLSADPLLLQKLATASSTWNLAPEVACEFELAFWKSQIDERWEDALSALRKLSSNAPWSTQRSEALLILGQAATRRGQWSDAQSYLEAASKLGDDVSRFRARSEGAALVERQGRLVEAAGIYEALERTAGAGVPNDFRVTVLRSAQRLWKTLGQTEDLSRVEKKITEKYPTDSNP